MKLELLLLVPADALVIYGTSRAARACADAPRLRSFWRLLTLAWTLELIADLILIAYSVTPGDTPFPSAADLFFLAFYPLMLVALIRVPTVAGTRSQRLRTLLDCATIMVGSGAAVWYFVVGPTLTEGGDGTLATLVSAAYPLADVALIGAIALIWIRRGPEALRLPLRAIGVGIVLLIAADMIYGYQQLHDSYLPGDPVDLLYVLVPLPFAYGASLQRRLGAGDPATATPSFVEPRPRSGWLPFAATVLGFAILLATQWQDKFFPDFSLLLFAIVLAGLAVARQHVAQRELSQLRNRMRTIVDGVAEGIVIFDQRGRIVWANPAAEATFEVAGQELEGEPVEALVEGVGWKQIGPTVGVGGDGSALGRRRKLTGRRRSGALFPLELIVTEATLDGRRVLIAIGQDVSERERTEAALRESERRFRGIYDNAGIGIAFSAFAEERPRIVDVNPAFEAMVGYTRGDLLGDDFSLIAHPEDAGALAEIGAAVAAGESRITRELRHLRRDGSVVWVSLTVSILRDEAGAPSFAIGMIEDVTRRKEAERVKDEFVSVVSHELRTPLTSIRGSLGLLEGGVVGKLPAEATHMLSTAVSNTDRLVRLINDILDIERIDSGRIEIEPAPVPAAELVTQSLEVVASVAAEAGVQIVVDAGEGIVVAADADRVVQALTNLLANAIKFSPPESAVTVTVRERSGWALLSVTDRGRGIPADQLESIFQRFEQVDVSDAREKGGTGLGLAIARSIVEHHGGRIWAESTEGRGARFQLTLPLAKAGATLTASPGENP